MANGTFNKVNRHQVFAHDDWTVKFSTGLAQQT
ncbi:uncharacterized protein METZ01_LOCUS459743, partial [marine metagenome]